MYYYVFPCHGTSAAVLFHIIAFPSHTATIELQLLLHSILFLRFMALTFTWQTAGMQHMLLYFAR